MDFETLFLKDGVRPPNECKFDPMDFETLCFYKVSGYHPRYKFDPMDFEIQLSASYYGSKCRQSSLNFG